MTAPVKNLVRTSDSLAPTIARLVLGGVMLPHGLQKTVGLFGGHGFSGTMNFFTTSAGLPWLVAFLVIAAESLGALALIAGFMTRFCAASIGVVMLGAILTVHGQHGFFMNWFGNQQGEGFEYHLLAMGLALVLVVAGAGRWSVDKAIDDRL